MGLFLFGNYLEQWVMFMHIMTSGIALNKKEMKIIAIGDIHGRTIWKEIVQNETFDKIVFVGDYFDSLNIDPVKQIENFNDIIAFKASNIDKVVLLLGNHDYHYLPYIYETYSGFKQMQKFVIDDLLDNAIKNNYIQICYAHEYLLFSHAGITNT